MTAKTYSQNQRFDSITFELVVKSTYVAGGRPPGSPVIHPSNKQ